MAGDFLKNLIFKKLFSVGDKGMRLFNKIDYITLQAKAWAAVLQKIGEKKGEEYLFDLGFEAGDDASKDMIEKLKWKTGYPILGIKSVQNAMEILGFGRFELKMFQPKQGKVILHVKDNPITEEAKKMFWKESKICSFYRGVYSAHAINDACVIDCHLKETQCVCKGSRYCEWVSGYKIK